MCVCAFKTYFSTYVVNKRRNNIQNITMCFCLASIPSHTVHAWRKYNTDTLANVMTIKFKWTTVTKKLTIKRLRPLQTCELLALVIWSSSLAAGDAADLRGCRWLITHATVSLTLPLSMNFMTTYSMFTECKNIFQFIVSFQSDQITESFKTYFISRVG